MEPGASKPRQVGPYRIESRLGSGGMGEVYRAYDARLKRQLAIKQIKTDKVADATLRERFRREAQAAAGLSHPSIVQIYDIVESDEGDWIVMELIEGHSLKSLILNGPIDIGLALRLGREIAEGLAEAHARGIVHRDLKTENIMVTPSGHAKILDFGLAKQVRSELRDPTLSADGAIVGTVRAMSPEQAQGKPVDTRSDLFSLGTLLYEAVTGESPFYKTNATLTLTRICTMQQAPVRQVNPGVPLALSELIDHLLEKLPDHRPQTATAVAEALEKLTFDGSQATVVGRPLPGVTAAHPSVRPVGSGSVAATDLFGASRSGLGGSDSEMVVKTLLMNDLVDSTRWVETLGDEGAAALFHRHDRLARDLLVEHGGLEIDKADGFLLLFERPLAAVRYAVAYHEALDQLSRAEGVELKSRVGIHVGEVMLRRNPHRDVARGAKPVEVEGLAKPVVARLMGLAVGGQTLISRGVYDMARRGSVGIEALGELSWLGHGSYLMKGVEEAIEVFEVGREGLSPLAVPPDSDKAQRTGGILATRELKHRRQSSSRHRILFVLLPILALVVLYFALRGAPGAAPARPSVSVLGFKNSSGESNLAWLSTAFSEMLRTELAAGGQLRIVSGENVARMRLELDLPKIDTLATDTLEKIRSNLGTDYVVLGSYLAIGSEDARTVRLDFWLQDTIRGETIAASSERGSEADLFAIVARAGAHLRGELGLEAPSAEAAGAVKASISTSPEATALYARALAELRAYRVPPARDLLQQAVEIDPGYALAHAALSEAWLKLGYDQQAKDSGKRAIELAKEKDLPREDVLAIEARYHETATHWQQAIDTYLLLWDFFPDNVDYGLRLAEVQQRAGRDRDSQATVKRLRKLPEPASLDLRIDLAEGTAAYHLSDYRQAQEIAENAILQARRQNAKVLLADALLLEGSTLDALGGLESATAAFDESRRLYIDVGDLRKAAAVMTGHANALYNRGDLSGAERGFQEALSIRRRTGDRKGISTLLNNLAGVSRLRGKPLAAERMLQESLTLANELGDLRRVPTRLNHLGFVYLEQGDLIRAEEMARRARSAQASHGSQQGIAWDQYLSGEIAFARGDLKAAETYYHEALEISRAIGSQNLEGRTLTALGLLLLARGEATLAGQHFDDAEAIQSEREEEGFAARTRLARALLHLELEQPQEAEQLARSASVAFAREGWVDDETAAASVLASSLLAQDRLGAAREALAGTGPRAENSQNLSVRLAAAIVSGRLATAADRHPVAKQSLKGVVAEAKELGLLGLELTARLALGEAETASGDQEAAAVTLRTLAADADDKGFLGIALKSRRF